MFTAVLFTIAKMNGERKYGAYIHNGILLSLMFLKKKEKNNPALCDNVMNLEDIMLNKISQS